MGIENNGTFTSPSSEYKDSNITAVEGVDLSAQEAWTAINNASETISKNDDSVVVAVVDTGIDYTNDEIKMLYGKIQMKLKMVVTVTKTDIRMI